MANISARADAFRAIQANFTAAQEAGRISLKTSFDPNRVKEIVVSSPGNGYADQCQLVYLTRFGKVNRRVRRSYRYPALITN